MSHIHSHSTHFHNYYARTVHHIYPLELYHHRRTETTTDNERHHVKKNKQTKHLTICAIKPLSLSGYVATHGPVRRHKIHDKYTAAIQSRRGATSFITVPWRGVRVSLCQCTRTLNANWSDLFDHKHWNSLRPKMVNGQHHSSDPIGFVVAAEKCLPAHRDEREKPGRRKMWPNLLDFT